MAMLTYAQIKQQIRDLMADRRANSFEYDDATMKKAIDWACTEVGRRLGFTVAEAALRPVSGEVTLPETIIKVIRVMGWTGIDYPYPLATYGIMEFGPDGLLYFVTSNGLSVSSFDTVTGTILPFYTSPNMTGGIKDMKWGQDGNLYLLGVRSSDSANIAEKVSPTAISLMTVNLTIAGVGLPYCFEVDSAGGNFYIGEAASVISKVTFGGVWSIFAGQYNTFSPIQDGTAGGATFTSPYSMRFDASRTNLVVVDTGNNNIRNVTVPGAVVTTMAGPGSGASPGASGDLDGTGAGVRLNFPDSICKFSSTDPAFSFANFAFADNINHKVKVVNQSTLTEASQVKTLSSPGSVLLAFSGASGHLFASDAALLYRLT